MFRALNTYTLRNEWDKIAKKNLNSVIALCKDLDISAMEWLDRHLDEKNLAKDVKMLADNGITVFSIGPHVHLLAKPNEVGRMVADGKKWLELAQGAGIGNVRFQVGDGPLPKAFPPMPDFTDEEWADYDEQMQEAVDLSAKIIDPLLEQAESLGVTISIETHHSYSSNFRYMKLVNERWQSSRLAWIFDIGNYENYYMRWEGLEAIKARTAYVHAKAYDFDGNGFEKKLDYPKACSILNEAGFAGAWSIEFEGKAMGILGAIQTNELLKYCLATVEGSSYEMVTKFPSEKDLLKKYKQ
jgi:sugar phosphate isomerase/epimerase